MLADFEGMIESFATQGVRLRRYAAQTLSSTSGRFSDPGYTDETIVAVIQRPNGRQLQLLPENQRTEEVIRIDTSRLLRTAKPSSNQLADRILYNSDVYEIQTITDYVAQANYCQALAVKVGQ